MSLAETDLRVFLSPDSDLPPDVSILVQTEDGGGQKYVKAHRFPLSCVSPVFRGMFFGPIKETSEVVEVKETTAEAFERSRPWSSSSTTLSMVKLAST